MVIVIDSNSVFRYDWMIVLDKYLAYKYVIGINICMPKSKLGHFFLAKIEIWRQSTSHNPTLCISHNFFVSIIKAFLIQTKVFIKVPFALFHAIFQVIWSYYALWCSSFSQSLIIFSLFISCFSKDKSAHSNSSTTSFYLLPIEYLIASLFYFMLMSLVSRSKFLIS